MATTPPKDDPNDPDKDDGDDKDSFKITEAILLDFANKFESLLKDIGENPSLQSLTQWANGNLIGDDGKLLPGNTGELASANEVQTAFQALCKQVTTGLSTFRGVADSGFLTLKTIKAILDNASDDAISVTEMWEILNSIQTGAKTQTMDAPPAPKK
ncbi:hypothetical protein [Streptomyces sp. NPDC001927]